MPLKWNTSRRGTYRGVPRCCGAFTPSTRVVSIRRGRGWFTFDFERISGCISHTGWPGRRRRACAEHRGRSTRSEWPQNRKRDHPRPRLLETTRLDEVKAPQHRGTPRRHQSGFTYSLGGRFFGRIGDRSRNCPVDEWDRPMAVLSRSDESDL